jgi:hypothetical protein
LDIIRINIEIKFVNNHLGGGGINVEVKFVNNHLGGGSVVRAWDQEVCFFCGLRFEPCGCSYDGYWRLT